jgi:hypothetical protein
MAKMIEVIPRYTYKAYYFKSIFVLKIIIKTFHKIF